MCHQVMFQMISHIYRQYFRGPTDSRETLSSGDENEEETIMLQEENARLQNKINYHRAKELEFQKVLNHYDNLLGTMVAARNSVSEQNDLSRNYLFNLEKAFYDLLQKYEKSKIVIQGFQNNEIVLRHQLFEYQKLVQNLKIKTREQPKSTIKPVEDGKRKKRKLLTTM